MLSNFFLNRSGYEIMCINIVEWSTPQMTIWRIRVLCRMPKTKNTHSEYVIFIAFPLQRWLQERVSLLRYKYCLV
jgi:hypothetical protein